MGHIPETGFTGDMGTPGIGIGETPFGETETPFHAGDMNGPAVGDPQTPGFGEIPSPGVVGDIPSPGIR
jgi:hypothetical protein